MDVRDVTRALVSDNSDAVRAIFPAKWGVDQVLSGTILPVVMCSGVGAIISLQTLVELGADINKRIDNSPSALIFACLKKQHAMLAYLLVAPGVDLKSTDFEGNNMFHTLVKQQDWVGIDILMAAGHKHMLCDTNRKGQDIFALVLEAAQIAGLKAALNFFLLEKYRVTELYQIAAKYLSYCNYDGPLWADIMLVLSTSDRNSLMVNACLDSNSKTISAILPYVDVRYVCSGGPYCPDRSQLVEDGAADCYATKRMRDLAKTNLYNLIKLKMPELEPKLLEMAGGTAIPDEAKPAPAPAPIATKESNSSCCVIL